MRFSIYLRVSIKLKALLNQHVTRRRSKKKEAKQQQKQ